MKIRFIFPAIVIYTNKVEKNGGYVVRGKTIGPVVIIGKTYARDQGLLEHELTHTRLFWRNGLLVHLYLYSLCRRYRLYVEARAYKAQYKEWAANGPTEQEMELKKEDFVDRIWLFYKLKYDREYIKKYFYGIL